MTPGLESCLAQDIPVKKGGRSLRGHKTPVKVDTWLDVLKVFLNRLVSDYTQQRSVKATVAATSRCYAVPARRVIKDRAAIPMKMVICTNYVRNALPVTVYGCNTISTRR
jgi:hypothetical protein